MVAVLLAVHLLLAIFLIAVVLMQRSEGGALGMGGGGGGGGGGLMTSRGAGNLLTRSTAILPALWRPVWLWLSSVSQIATQGRFSRFPRLLPNSQHSRPFRLRRQATDI